jgi:hypothetical protein
LLKNDKNSWKFKTMEIIGDKPVAPNVFISDHYGVYASIKLK